MSNFPVGSKIIINNADYGEAYENGDILTIANSDDTGVWISCADGSYYVSNREFEAYTEPFKAGDTVITTADNEEWTYAAGVEGTVTHIDTDEPKICVSGLGYVHTWDLKLAPVDEPERKFKVGDKVVVQANPKWGAEGRTGVIVQIDVYHGSSLPYYVKWDDGSCALYMRAQDLELVKEFAFTDILKGDTIRAEYTQDDVKYIQEGVADREKYEGWVSKTGIWIAAPHYENATYTLLERTEPPKPNPFAEAGVGSVAGEKDGYVWLKTANDTWQFFRQTEEHSLSSAIHGDHHMNNGRWTLLHNA